MLLGVGALLLAEPTNDVDADMLAALEDLLDSWPGTLIVVSHDRYLVERVTDDQYAVLNGELRHLPGGIDEYLARSEDARQGAQAAGATPEESEPAHEPVLSGAERHALQKEVSSLERRIDRRTKEIEKLHEKLAAHDQSDYEGLGEITAEVRGIETDISSMEERWIEISEQLG